MKIELSPNEAIVLFEFLQRYSKDGLLGIEDQAEQRILWGMQCLLEKSIGECFEGEWDRALKHARNAIRDERKTNAAEEKEKGRLALWLEPSQIQFLLKEWRALPANSSDEKLNSWGKIAFMGSSALHIAGLEKE